MKSKAYHKLLPTILLLLVALAVVSSATYAWFSMNTAVRGTGISVRATAPTNMLISVDTSLWENGVTANTAIDGNFSPSSTIDGTTFFAIANTNGIDVNGSIVDDGNRTTVELAQVDRIQDVNVYYAEFPLYIKASEQTSLATDLTLYLSEMTVATAGTTDITNTARVSITTVGRNTGVVTVNNDGTVQDSSDNILTESAAIIYKYDTTTTVLPISAVDGSGTPTLSSDTAIAPGNSSVTCFTVDYTGTEYTTIIVRIWLEGQHPACVNAITGETISLTLSWEVSNYSA